MAKNYLKNRLPAGLLLCWIVLVAGTTTMSAQSYDKYNKLSKGEERVIVHKGTEVPFSGRYNNFFETGAYLCKRCNAPLFQSNDKFVSSCGWPSFDDEIKGAVKRQTDADGRRVEILCANCGGHLGHVFEGEGLTAKNLRHCVNSISMTFKPATTDPPQKAAYFAGGCFWGVEHFFEQQKGVVSVISGYMGGGNAKKPSYREVCSGSTGHFEVVKVVYDPAKTNYEKLARFFFEIHDPTQANGQGPDIGDQYLSVIFYDDAAEKKTAQNLIALLTTKGYNVATKILPNSTFWEAEAYHQNYYKKTGKMPYCHRYEKRF